MARRKEHTHEEINEMAIVAVMEYLQAASLDGLSLRKVASQIGYAPSTLINIYGSYQQLLLRVSERVLVNLYQHLADLNVDCSQDEPINIIEAMAHGYCQFAFEHKAGFKLVFEISAPDNVSLSSSHQHAIDSLFGLISQQLKHVFAQVSEQQITLMSRVLWGGIHGLTCLAIDGKLFTTETELPTMLSSHVQGYILGMTKNKDAAC
ncbi:hypothetical protein A9267_18510 [Shewanella sp. UCD-FRSSP16_17]|uniref:TetR/AcrR family transcriptional regulator n=1 Tax=Shewanella sp. UCD-FRSSP16_17 TaxID=1853256 RepID=UPI0007EECC9B|nr:TetR-like C-terminal domain-containing protein [Shewanella sp. UCD-FRSSP16_17]OBT04282.1 hypothetical protein A9267_18510 [Shewanella sp. UCD-FRSSP16_17]